MPTIKLKRGTSAVIPTLALGEPGFTTDTKRLYVGNGTNNTMFYNASELPLRIMPVILTNGDTSFKKVGINENFNTASPMSSFPVDLRCCIANPSTDRVGGGSVGFGFMTKPTGTYSFATNQYNTAAGTSSNAFGYMSEANSLCGFASGTGAVASTAGMTSIGYYNIRHTGALEMYSAMHNAFVIGNGYSDGARSNCFRVRFDGSTYGVGAFNSSGADYAEYFEWFDGNPSSEDRVGRFVTTTIRDTIVIASNIPLEDILGVVSGNASVIGNTASAIWHNAYLKDDFGRVEYEISYDESGNAIKKPKLNPSYDPSQPYESREKRKEWDPIGLLGRLRVRDDGSCVVGARCGCGANGVATKVTLGSPGFKVLKRISTNVIEILMK